MEFSESEKENVLLSKMALKIKLSDLYMTTEKLGNPFKQGWYLSGGAIGSLLRNEYPNDFDIYFKSGDLAQPVYQLFVDDPSYQNEVEIGRAHV